jgi:hypothetical protein
MKRWLIIQAVILLTVVITGQNRISNYQFICNLRTKPKCFSGKGKLGFMNLIAFTLDKDLAKGA